jgi:opacity protein-like surface antigen
MTRRSKIAALVLGASSFACGTAFAADMPQYGYQPQPVQEFVSGWYLRGDIGWRSDTKIGDVVVNPSAYAYALPANATLDNIAMFGIGAGYKWNWLRLDVTTDYGGRAKFRGDYTYPNEFTGQIDTWTMLANAYIDLGTWGGFTPYVGAGAGFVTFRAANYVSPLSNETTNHQTRTDFAWAYMAGLAWCFAPKWMVDFSYRRLNYGEVNFNPPLASPLTLKDLSANEFRVGIRYSLD